MRAPVLCAVIVISLVLGGVIEFLAQKSQKQGGLALSLSEDEIPQSVNIAYLYMPTTIAVLYSLIWTWIDLDVRRMQPWFELSRSNGAKGDQSLLLDYPFEFLALVPVTAWKHRHWPVFIVGIVSMLVFWTITPLQGAIFGKQAVDLTQSVAMSITSGLMPVEEQAAAIDASILDTAYGITCEECQPLGGSLVELTTPSRLDDTAFNRSEFEFLLHAGFSSIVIARDYPDNLILDQYAKLYKTGISWPTTNMVGFAIGLHNGSLADFANTTILHQSYAAAHKLIFSSAISKLLSQSSNPGDRDGLVKYTLYGIVVSRPFSIAVECLLAIVAVLAAGLYYTIVRSTSHLDSDPDSTTSLFRMIQKEEIILSHFSDKDRLHGDDLKKTISSDRYHLEASDNTAGPMLHLLSCKQEAGSSDNVVTGTTAGSSSNIQSIRPKELRPAIGIIFILVLAAAIGVLAYLKHQEISMRGLVRPSQNFEVLQLLENYIPMVFSTLLEPFLTLLNRLLCVFQPYNDLLKGRSSPQSTIETKYDSLPPQLIIWRALKAGHYFLALLSVVVLLANVLSVGLGAIFNESPTSVSTTLSVTPLKLPSVSRSTMVPSGVLGNGPYFDHLYMVQTNLSADTLLPAWIDTQFFYLPFADSTAKDNTSAKYNAMTRGFGFEATCSLLPTSNISRSYVEYDFNVTTELGNQAIAVHHEDTPFGNSTACAPYAFVHYSEPTVGKYSQEIYSPLEQVSGETTTAEATAFCNKRLLLGWMRYDTAQPKVSPNTTFMECTTEMVSARFNVTVDGNGRILSSMRIGDYDNITDVIGSGSANLLSSANLLIGDSNRQSSGGLSLLAWHNNSLTTDWMNYYLKIADNTTDYVDPSKPLPNATSLIPTVEKMYQRIGAALLGANQDLFLDPANTTSANTTSANTTSILSAVIVTQETRIFMDNTAFIISLTILSIYLIVGVAFYARQRVIMLPRMPTTIGSAVAFVAASRAVRMYRGPEKGVKPEETYSFGRFVGVDGKTHIGIELDPYVVPLNPRSTWLGAGTWRRWRRRQAGATNEPANDGFEGMI
ncbi:hypothetical protein SLS53_000066 [Cytospora paraplurivora]|uniref:Uncharacterized protein n=1 Tax=Cytospora paraplurivora TaxID=2898453 RepID=A0AAN9ULX6_9PEZI